MTVLITGAAGYVGRSLVEALGRAGVPVIAQVRRDPPAGGWWPPPMELRRGDLADIGEARRACLGVSTVVHCAARVRGGTPAGFFRDNVQATDNLWRYAPRVVLMSTVAVYGQRGQTEAGEDTALRPEGEYARTKVAAERIVGNDGVALRLGAVWGGPHDHRLTQAVAWALKTRCVWLPGRCDTPMPLLHVDNLAEAVKQVLTTDVRGMFNLTDASGLSFRGFVEAMASARGLPAPRGTLSVASLRRVLGGAALARQKLTGSAGPLRPETLELLNTPCTFSIQRAQEAFGYAPVARRPV